MSIAAPCITRVRELLDYEPQTGHLTWRQTRPPVRRGDRAGSQSHSCGYRMVCVDYYRCLEHRLIWFYVHGSWPVDQLDHINGDRTDNRISNLRECSAAENGQNQSASGKRGNPHVGVSWWKTRGQWAAYITRRGRRHHLGYFNDLDGAINAYLSAKSRLHTFSPEPRSA